MAKLKIIRCKIQNGQIKEQKGAANTFQATINPQDYSHTFGLKYSGTGSGGSKAGALNKSAPVAKFASTESEKLSFSIVLDGTGVVVDAAKVTVAQQIDKLRTITYDYDGDEHEPTPVKIIWGKGLKAFYGRLTSLGVDYNLFHPDGTALRAKVKVDFVEAKTDAEEAREAKRKSPDMTHMIRVQQGDTLPLLCQRVYKDVSKYLEIARINELDNFRDLQPNTLLRFPPIR